MTEWKKLDMRKLELRPSPGEPAALYASPIPGRAGALDRPFFDVGVFGERYPSGPLYWRGARVTGTPARLRRTHAILWLPLPAMDSAAWVRAGSKSDAMPLIREPALAAWFLPKNLKSKEYGDRWWDVGTFRVEPGDGSVRWCGIRQVRPLPELLARYTVQCIPLPPAPEGKGE